MVKLNKKQTKAITFMGWWSNYIYWIPTIQTELHLLPDGVLTNMTVNDGEFSADGNNFGITFYILGLVINISYWWKLKRKRYNQETKKEEYY